ncbi:MAG: hypothetical protein VX341_09405 [Bdellovibrionota bacterium]|nr:hypothetical protein [Bdellovibrionota bacterium]
MIKISATILSIISLNVTASDIVKVPCITHAQCQTYTELSTGCFIVKNKEGACEEKCLEIETSSYCDFKENSNYGYCVSESLAYKKARLNINDMCDRAVPLKDIEHLL